jgi:CMP-N,N'-diacetyllegionaminic acid synthase
MKILAIIPARSGSKRIQEKNKKKLAGKPLVSWTIDFAKKSNKFIDILVTTDDIDILDISKKSKVLAPWLRPQSLSGDSATTFDTIIHALDWYEKEKGVVDGVFLLQPTSPFRNMNTLNRFIDLFYQNQLNTIISVSPAKSHPAWCFEIHNGILKSILNPAELNKRSQDLNEVYEINGAYYLFSPANIRKNKSLFCESMIPMIIKSEFESLDIDTIWDWVIAEAAINFFSK